MIYGLKHECYADLMRIYKSIPYQFFGKNDQKTTPKKRNQLGDKDIAAVINAADRFEGKYMSIADAIETAIANGWPGNTAEDILERYRKSPKRAENVLNLYREFPDNSLEADPVKASCLYDNEVRQGDPRGPSYCSTLDQLTDKYVELLEKFVCLNGIEGMLDEKQRTPCHPENPQKQLTIEGILAAIQSRTLPEAQFSPAFVDRIVGCAAYEAILPQELRDLRGVYVYVPLDCHPATRDGVINKIVNDWKAKRAEAGYKNNLRPRLTKRAEISRIRLLPKYVNQLRNLCQNKHEDKTSCRCLPRTCKGTVEQNSAMNMTIAFIAKHIRLNPGCLKNDDILYKSIQDGLEEASQDFDHGPQPDSPRDDNIEAGYQ